MSDPMRVHDSELIAELNDLLQLDHDAVQGYTIAINTVRNNGYREVLVAFRHDHKRHIETLSTLVRARGGIATEMSHRTGPLKLVVQALGGAGPNDAAVLLAFKAVEGQVRDKYRRHAMLDHPEDVQTAIEKHARDEDVHYRWVSTTLQDLGYGDGTVPARAERVVEKLHKAVVDPAERVARKVMETLEEHRPRHT
jgi:hypothetical protein